MYPEHEQQQLRLVYPLLRIRCGFTYTILFVAAFVATPKRFDSFAFVRMAAQSRQVVNAYRQLYRGLLQAVQYSKPARYTARDKLRLTFRNGCANNFDQAGIDATVAFLQYAARERGIEHRIVRNLLHVWHWQARLAKLKLYDRKSKTREEMQIERAMYYPFKATVGMLNSSMGLCIPSLES